MPEPSAEIVMADPPEVADSSNESPEAEMIQYTVPTVRPPGSTDPGELNTHTVVPLVYADPGARMVDVADGPVNA
jgi:hypothetical protein